jgi:hypothetical protein
VCVSGASRSSNRSRGGPTTAPPRNSTATYAKIKPPPKTSAVANNRESTDLIEGQEDKSLLTESAAVLSQKEAVAIFEEIDNNGNGEISQV